MQTGKFLYFGTLGWDGMRQAHNSFILAFVCQKLPKKPARGVSHFVSVTVTQFVPLRVARASLMPFTMRLLLRI